MPPGIYCMCTTVITSTVLFSYQGYLYSPCDVLTGCVFC